MPRRAGNALARLAIYDEGGGDVAEGREGGVSGVWRRRGGAGLDVA